MCRLICCALLAIAVCGCSRNSTYIDCKVAQERSGVSQDTAAEYCAHLAKEKKISCDGDVECQALNSISSQ